MRKAILFLSGMLLLLQCSPYQKLSPMKSMVEDLRYPFPVKFQELSSGPRMAYMEQGQGAETIILIHGLGSYSPAWKNNIPALAEKYRVIAIDLPGYGKSSKGPWTGSLEFYAESLMEFADSLKLKSFHLGGHSMGGQISMVAALKYPERIQKLILVAPAGFEPFHPGQKDWFRSVATPSLTLLAKPRQIRENFAINFYAMPEDAEFMVEDRIAMRSAEDFPGYAYIVAQSIKAMVDRPVYDYLEQIQQKTLIVFGKDDMLIPNRFLTGGSTNDIAKIGDEKIPDSQLIMLEKAGHFVQFEAFERFNQSVLEFLAP
ncbi:alpha/beta fold hydrolase [Croceimicrobium hydrocarbonivorans]|uniref:Alpha/beta hydrolase n=1 Tax=Croceimicrobium hydrocarbonivorans TaxID=2761580 RepID=A0A7H0VII5_9FLAO|nr:alpha/beta hydrolase [Croceimicrobium hydrocarbonivorans]QNR25533.1 alpha/beta hydrolase [Croceimicrobium hydrocarbonivorans]